jgi:hypothetical protein
MLRCSSSRTCYRRSCRRSYERLRRWEVMSWEALALCWDWTAVGRVWIPWVDKSFWGGSKRRRESRLVGMSRECSSKGCSNSKSSCYWCSNLRRSKKTHSCPWTDTPKESGCTGSRCCLRTESCLRTEMRRTEGSILSWCTESELTSNCSCPSTNTTTT